MVTVTRSKKASCRLFSNLINTGICILLLNGCASLPDNSGRKLSYTFTNTQNSKLGKDVHMISEISAGLDSFILLDDGLDAFVARAVLAEDAEHSLDVQYYLYHQDQVGSLFTGFLVKAADRGVRVRLLMDDINMGGRDAEVIVLDSHPNIEIRLFNPFDRKIARTPQFVTGLGSVTRRMHNKSFTADNQMTILGGRNIGNEYFDADPSLEFTDLDVLAVGSVVQEVSDSFDLYWNSELSYPASTLISERPAKEEMQAMHDELLVFMEQQLSSDYMSALLNSDLAKKLEDDTVEFYHGDAVVLVDHPEKITSSRDATELHLSTQLEPYFEDIKKELIVISPYFVPGKEGIEFFSQLTGQGVRVRILTNSLSSNDVPIVHAGYSKYRKALLRSGVELYELNKRQARRKREDRREMDGSSKASLHTKTFILDRETVFIGSLNLDPRSFYENSEIGVIIHSADLAADMADRFHDELEKDAFRLELNNHVDEQLLWHGYENGKPVQFDVEPYTGFWRRLGVNLMSLLPIESQL